MSLIDRRRRVSFVSHRWFDLSRRDAPSRGHRWGHSNVVDDRLRFLCGAPVRVTWSSRAVRIQRRERRPDYHNPRSPKTSMSPPNCSQLGIARARNSGSTRWCAACSGVETINHRPIVSLSESEPKLCGILRGPITEDGETGRSGVENGDWGS